MKKKKNESENSGGAVLKPEGSFGSGLKLIKEMLSVETFAHFFVNDLDFSSIYPVIQIVLNISRSTTLFTVVAIENFFQEDIHDLFSCLISIRENSVYICKKFFNLPSYMEMEKLIDLKLKGANSK